MSGSTLPAALVQVGLTNAALVVLLSLVVLLVGRWSKNAHLQALLWLLVVVKLIAPPLLPFTYVIERESGQTVYHQPVDIPREPVETDLLSDISVASPSSWNETTSVAQPPPQQVESIDVSKPTSVPTISESQLSHRVESRQPLDWMTVLLIIWLSGTALAIITLVVHGNRFRRLTLNESMHEPSPQLAAAFDALCTSIRVQRTPRLRVIDARVSPIAWSGIGRASILIPKELTERLTFTQQQMVLAHELAHVRRGDLTVRWFELCVQSLYWWFLPLRWIRSQLHAAQETCCDAMVNRHFPNQQDDYSETLLTVAQWLTDEHPVPAWSTSFGRPITLRQRIKTMLEQPPSRPLTDPAWTLVVTVGLLISTLTVRWAFAAPPEPSTTPAPAVVAQATESDAETESESVPSVMGRVVDPDGRPIADVWLIVQDNRNLFQLYGDGLIPQSDADGRFDLGDVAPGRRRLTAFSPDWSLQTKVVDFPSTDPVEFVMEKGHRVEFRTVDTQGNPIAGIKFHPEAPRYTPFQQEQQKTYLYPHSSYLHVLDFLSHRYLINNKSDENGRFVWENAPADTLYYQIGGSNYLTHPGGDFGPDSSPHTLVFRERIPVIGRVVDAVTGEAIPDFQVQRGGHFKSNRQGSWSWSIPRLKRETPGQFADLIYNLGRTVRYRVDAKGYLPDASRILDPEDIRDSSVSLEFALRKDTGFAGTILTPNGEPAEEASVSLISYQVDNPFVGSPVDHSKASPSEDAEPITVDSLGRFRLPPQQAPYVCVVTHKTGYQSLPDIDLMQKSIVSLQPWSAVEGQVFLDGKPAAGLPVNLSRRGSTRRRTQSPLAQNADAITDADGHYRFERCMTGEWNLWIVYGQRKNQADNFISSGDSLRMPLTTLPGQTLVRDVGRDTVTVIGRVAVPDDLEIDASRSTAYLSRWVNEPVRQYSDVLPINLRRTRVSLQTCPLEHDGTLRFINVSPGEHELSLHVAIQGKHPHFEAYTASRIITAEAIEDTSPLSSLDIGELLAVPSVQ